MDNDDDDDFAKCKTQDVSKISVEAGSGKIHEVGKASDVIPVGVLSAEVTLTAKLNGGEVASLRFMYRVEGQKIFIEALAYKSVDTGFDECYFYLRIDGGPQNRVSDKPATQDGQWHSFRTSFSADVKDKATIQLIVFYHFQGDIWFEATGNYAVWISLPKPLILSPKTGMTVGAWPWFFGSGEIGAAIQILNGSTGAAILHFPTVVTFPGVWGVYLAAPLSLGEHEFTAVQTLDDLTSAQANSVRITVARRPPPVIESPLAGSVQDTSFTLGGSGGRPGTYVQVLKDGTDDTVFGERAVTEALWSCAVEVPPGPISLVAILKTIVEKSDVSAPMAYRIRPPALTSVTVTHTDEKTITFSGDGYTDATVQISVESSDQPVTPPTAVNVREGKWATPVSNWPPGTYHLKVIQKLPDHANGWIESLPYSFTFSSELPVQEM